jgi:hypothetical protein
LDCVIPVVVVVVVDVIVDDGVDNSEGDVVRSSLLLPVTFCTKDTSAVGAVLVFTVVVAFAGTVMDVIMNIGDDGDVVDVVHVVDVVEGVVLLVDVVVGDGVDAATSGL